MEFSKENLNLTFYVKFAIIENVRENFPCSASYAFRQIPHGFDVYIYNKNTYIPEEERL